LATDLALRAVVQENLEIEWSPEQIAGRLRVAFPDTPGWHLCHETDLPSALPRGAWWSQLAADQAAEDGQTDDGVRVLCSTVPAVTETW
jgi:hypothetical protein